MMDSKDAGKTNIKRPGCIIVSENNIIINNDHIQYISFKTLYCNLPFYIYNMPYKDIPSSPSVFYISVYFEKKRKQRKQRKQKIFVEIIKITS